MAHDGRSIRGLSEKIHPLFIELYLASDSDDDEQAGRRARKRGSVARKRVMRKCATQRASANRVIDPA
jgi:hypothetical protein